MLEGLRKAIIDIIRSEGVSEDYALIANTIRVLSLYGGTLWLREIANEIMSFTATVEGFEVKVELEELRRAINILKGRGIVDYEVRFRSIPYLERSIEEPLVKLKNPLLTIDVLREVDGKYLKFIEEREKALESLRRLRSSEG